MNQIFATPYRRLPKPVPGLAFIALLIALFELAASQQWTSPIFSPVPSLIAASLASVVMTGEIVPPVLATLGLFLAGYLLACVAGVALGLLIGYSRAVYSLLEPLLELLRPIPKPALLPPLILLFGLGAPMKIAIVFLGALFPVLINTVQGVRSTDPVLIDVARTFRRGSISIVLRVILPASLPIILAGMRVSLGVGLVLVVLAEMLTGAHGLGAYIVDLQRLFRVQEMYAWIVILALLGLGLATCFNWIEAKLIFWSSRR